MGTTSLTAEPQHTLRERLFASKPALAIVICGAWLVAARLSIIAYHLLRVFAGDFATGRQETVESYTVDVARKSAADLARWIRWDGAWITILPALALCTWLSLELRKSDWRTELRRMGWVRPRRSEVALLAAALPAMLVLEWRYGLHWSGLWENGLPALPGSFADPMITFGFCFLALRELAGFSSLRAVVTMVAVYFGLTLVRDVASPAPLNLLFELEALILIATLFALQAWLYVRWGARIWAVAFAWLGWQLLGASWPRPSLSTSTSVLGVELSTLPQPVEIPSAAAMALQLSVPVLAVLWTLHCTKPLRVR